MSENEMKTVDSHKEASTSGLTEKEKIQIPIDVDHLSPPTQQGNRLLSKEKLSAILEKSSKEENLGKTWDDEGKMDDFEKTETQLIVYKEPLATIPPINLSAMFDILANLRVEQVGVSEAGFVNQENEFLDEIASDSDTKMAYDETMD
ncbi:OLC1v1005096C1 [Oldenlandia corymbosa var. corymbosa]|uniref:OLC1v1005096C1 n=1 Tax=Oldenlandia corymbosa var. corymbosa TaxID=529605 RepID=A0AAV1DFV1_OLDCO|nr:OLC1v1005096C1 [Oldenlandia corymbosa var. corymbosa]